MKSKHLLLLILIYGCLSATTKTQFPKADRAEMVLIEPSTFMMGIDSMQLKNDMQKYNAPFSVFSQEYPAFRVHVQAFYIDKYEVSNMDFKKFIEANPQWSKENIPDSLHDGNYLKDWKRNNYPKGKDNYPVVYVNWYVANVYAHWKNKRLPTESEWESAAKGLNKSAEFPWGNEDIDFTRANFLPLHIGQAVKVGSYAPNSLGLYDMAGNVYEFCADSWQTDRYANLVKFRKNNNNFLYTKPLPEDKNKKVVRGGSWNSQAIEMRTTHREWRLAISCLPDVGFRCAASIPVIK